MISTEGYAVGITSEELTYDGEAFSPYFGGVATSEIEWALDELGIGIQLPVERYE